ncbi:MAG: hypothetical protein QXU32_08635 [Nitrososphaerales archaeon]
MSKIEFGKGDLAKYPFLTEAGQYLKELDYSLAEFDEQSKMHVIERAYERIITALDGNIYRELDDLDTEVVSFLIALIMVRALGVRSVSRKYSLGEARRTEMFLEQELKHESEERMRAILTGIFNDLFSIDVIQENGKFKVKVADYLKRASYFHDNHWKLVNRTVNNGFVYLNSDETVRLIRDELTLYIYDKINKMELRQLPEAIKTKVNELRNRVVKDAEFKRYFTTTKYPPCVEHVLQVLSKGENPPHSARFLLATYMLSIGKTVDEVCNFFEAAPDYNERVTRYQVEHLTGMRGSGTKYTCPSCEKVASDNNCYRTEECDGIVNPVRFGRGRVGSGRAKPESG